MSKRAAALAKIRAYLRAVGRGYRFFGINARYIAVSFLVILVAMLGYIAVASYGFYVSTSDFVVKANALLEAKGIAGRLESPDVWSCILGSFHGYDEAGKAMAAASSLGITDKAIIDELNLIERQTVSMGILCYAGGILIVAVFFLASGFLIGFLIKRRNNVPYGWKLTLVSLLMKSVIFAGLLFGLSTLFGLIPIVGGILAAILIPLVQSLFSLYRAHMVQRGLSKTLGMFRFVSPYDVLVFLGIHWTLYLSLVIMAVGVAIALSQWQALIILLLLPLVSYTNAFLDVYAEVMVLEKAARLKAIAAAAPGEEIEPVEEKQA